MQIASTDRGDPAWRLALLGMVLVAMVAVGPSLHRAAGDLAFNALGVAHGLLVLWALSLAGRAPSRRVMVVIIVVAVLLRLALLFVPPHLSTDAFRYVWDGRVQGAGINPYRYVPAAPELAPLRDAAIWPFINRADYAVTIYPPAAEIFFFLVGRIADGLVPLKLALIACEAVTMLVLRDLLRRMGQPETRLIAYAWHPLAVWEISGSAHVDGAMVAVLVLGIWVAVAARRPVLAAGVLAVAALIKPLAALALPLAWKPWGWRAPAMAIGTAALLYVPYLSVGTGIFAFVGGYVQEEGLESGDAFWPVWLVQALAGPQGWAKPLYLLLAAALLLAMAFRLSFAAEEGIAQRLRRLSWLFLMGVLALSPGYPWYFLCLVPFVVLVGAPPFWAATIACYLLYDEIPGDASIAFWVRDGALHLAIIASALWMLRPRAPATAPQPRITEEPSR
ncbi:hypothetical protein EOD42_18105 [Rhodovarius crocodyli]|uniref:DUF2029 domain-containing protein n=1 Tax=Rhodovarius crocodyli TaxID=1979269 RepID=A0A437M3C2_9PROT|nr:hypothetical protein [Rhodovarius crocodyli]RVT92132.1 hypothetical protein EOD42_18105 [Rhodovarius crocodyli]